MNNLVGKSRGQHTGRLPPTGIRTVTLSFKVSFAFRQHIKRLAVERGVTMNEILVAAIEAYAPGEVTCQDRTEGRRAEGRQEIQK